MPFDLCFNGPCEELLLSHIHSRTHTHREESYFANRCASRIALQKFGEVLAHELCLLEIYYLFEAGRSICARWRGRQCESCRESEIARQQVRAHSERETSSD